MKAALGAIVVSAAVFTVHAQPSHAPMEHSAHHAQGAMPAPAEPVSEGEVRKVDLPQSRVTLRHGPLANLGMPAMTMVFKAADSKLLQGLKEGDKVKFTADRKDGALVVTALQIVH